VKKKKIVLNVDCSCIKQEEEEEEEEEATIVRIFW
jgi:hypothetical protein